MARGKHDGGGGGARVLGSRGCELLEEKERGKDDAGAQEEVHHQRFEHRHARRLAPGPAQRIARCGFAHCLQESKSDFVDFVFIRQDCRCQPVPFPSQDRVGLASQIEHWAPPAVVQGAAPDGSRFRPSGQTARLALHVPPLVHHNVPNRRTPPWGELGYWKQRNAGNQSPLHARPSGAPSPPPLIEPTMPALVVFSLPASLSIVSKSPLPRTKGSPGTPTVFFLLPSPPPTPTVFVRLSVSLSHGLRLCLLRYLSVSYYASLYNFRVSECAPP
jgi:hypothetical protein